MKLLLEFEDTEINAVRSFFEIYTSHPLVEVRRERNLRSRAPQPTVPQFWNRLVGCLLTTQQRSGPASPLTQFLLTSPMPLEYSICEAQADLAQFTRDTLKAFGGLRRANVIGGELAANLQFLNNGGWDKTLRQLETLRHTRTAAAERTAARYLAANYKGLGPKQSRNVLLGLGLSKYEIPIDSRVTRWLNNYHFPIALSARPLQDEAYYSFVSQGVQQLCAACDLIPCLLDAAIFASFDSDEWTTETAVW